MDGVELIWLLLTVCSAYWIIMGIVECRITGPVFENGVWRWEIDGSVITAGVIFLISLIVLICLILSKE